MRRSLNILFVWLVAAGPVFAMCVEIPVTTSSLDTYSYTFAVSTNTATNGVAFHIVITAKRGAIDANYCSGRLDTVRDQNGSNEIFQEPFEAAIPVMVQKHAGEWTVDFILPHELLKSPDLYFVFWEQAVSRTNGKTEPMPAGTFYEMWLMDFANPRSSIQLETPTYKITITLDQEYVVSSDDIKFVCVNKKTGKSINLTGRTDHTIGADGVTPSHFLGYVFTNQQMVYYVTDGGEFSITEGTNTVADEQGQWNE